MRALIRGTNFWPELTSVGKYSSEMPEWLAEAGHEVRVGTVSPFIIETAGRSNED